MAYNYLDAVKDDVRQYIEDEIPTLEGYAREDLEQDLNDILWDNDSVTGNGSGSYTFDREKAKEYLFDSTDGESYLADALDDYGIDAAEVGRRFMSQDYEWFDVTIRCYVLGQAISEVLDELYEE